MQELLKNILLGKQKNCEFIPLGVNCAPSHTLRKIGLRKSALPFVWNTTTITALWN